MPTYTYDHIHLRSREPMETARYYSRVFDARIIESVLRTDSRGWTWTSTG